MNETKLLRNKHAETDKQGYLLARLNEEEKKRGPCLYISMEPSITRAVVEIQLWGMKLLKLIWSVIKMILLKCFFYIYK